MIDWSSDKRLFTFVATGKDPITGEAKCFYGHLICMNSCEAVRIGHAQFENHFNLKSTSCFTQEVPIVDLRRIVE